MNKVHVIKQWIHFLMNIGHSMKDIRIIQNSVSVLVFGKFIKLCLFPVKSFHTFVGIGHFPWKIPIGMKKNRCESMFKIDKRNVSIDFNGNSCDVFRIYRVFRCSIGFIGDIKFKATNKQFNLEMEFVIRWEMSSVKSSATATHSDKNKTRFRLRAAPPIKFNFW